MTHIGQRDHFLGNPDSKIILLEYGDYQCPDCGHAYPLIKKLMSEHRNKICFVFRNFPLEEHAWSIIAAQTAEAASHQHKFWDMHDYIYEHQDEINENILIDFGERLNLNLNLLERDSISDNVILKIENDIEDGKKAGVHGTPTFFINNKKITNYDGSYESLLNAVMDYE